MATYSWRCQECDTHESTHESIKVGPVAPTHCGSPMVRDYRADRLQLAITDLKRQNQVGYSPNYVLPDAKYYESPSDPDGTKGLKEWNETHEPKGHSGRNRPKVKTSF